MTNINTSPLGNIPLVTLQKITLNYSDEQDRLLLLASGDDNQSYGFWLTRKLMKLLVKHFIKKFSPATRPTSHDRIVEELLLETHAQSAIQQHDKNTTPVSTNSLGQVLLIISVDISISDQLISLGWKSSDKQFKLGLSHAEFFQWLYALRNTLINSDWDIQWPSWIESADISQKTNRVQEGAVH